MFWSLECYLCALFTFSTVKKQNKTKQKQKQNKTKTELYIFSDTTCSWKNQIDEALLKKS